MLLAFFAVTGYSQTLEEVREMVGKKNYAGAKAAIDKYLADAKNTGKAEAWYLKGRVYNDYSNEKTTPQSELYNLKSIAGSTYTFALALPLIPEKLYVVCND